MNDSDKNLYIFYTGNGTAGREANVKPTGKFLQADRIGSYASDNPEHLKVDLGQCGFRRISILEAVNDSSY